MVLRAAAREREEIDEKYDAKSRSNASIYHKNWHRIDIYYMGVLQVAAQLVERAYSLHIVTKCTKSSPGHRNNNNNNNNAINRRIREEERETKKPKKPEPTKFNSIQLIQNG